MIIGLTGISGSGKGYVCRVFKEFGIDSIDTDAVVHSLYSENEECISLLRSYFGDFIIDSKGSIDRAVLAPMVFSDPEAMSFLNSTVHRYTLQVVDKTVDEYRSENACAVIVDAPLLFESGYDKKCDVVISVISDMQRRVERICERDGISREKATMRIKNQKSDSFFEENSDFLIYNNGEDVKNQVRIILEKLDLI